MRSASLVTVLLLGLLFFPLATATEGRAPPQCASLDLSDVVSSSTGVSVEPGACVIIDIGTRSYTTTLGFDIEVLDDAMDVLLFDQSSIQSYQNGQNYRSSFNKEVSFESMIGAEWLDWAPPQSISPKNWYLVFDNSAHDGDEGMGDQGGMTARFKLQLAPIGAEDYPLIHDTFLLQPNQRINMASFNVDSSTGLTYWAHPLSGDGDIFIQSDNQLSGDLIISGSKMDNFGGQDKTQIDWTVPVFLNLQNLNLIAEAGPLGLHFSVKAWFDPVLAPEIVDYSNSTTTIGESVILDAGNTPNGLQQLSVLSWDFDSDGIQDSTGTLVQAVWYSPGLKTINLTVQSKSGETSIASHQVEVIDVKNPNAVITGIGGVMDLNGDRRLLRLSDLVLQATNSNDDDGIASASWAVDGEQVSSASQFTFMRSEIGSYLVTLTVSDPSGNIGSTNLTVIVYDSTEPILVTSDITAISKVEQGKEVEFRAKAADEWDAAEDLRFTWDLDLNNDANKDGDSTNDPDYEGATLKISFDDVGKTKFAVTVYDQSNNTDFEIFEIEVTEPADNTGLILIIASVFAVVIVVSGVVLFGYRGIQRRHAVELLIQRGFSAEEAEARVLDMTRNVKLPAFAKAAQIAGMSEGYEPKSTTQMETEAKAREFEAIYGGSSQSDPNAGFRPAVRQVDPALAEAALAAFADEAQAPAVISSVSTPSSGKVRSGGIALPQKSAPVKHSLKSHCTSCSQDFLVEIDQGARSVLVSCPHCGADQLFER